MKKNQKDEIKKDRKINNKGIYIQKLTNILRRQKLIVVKCDKLDGQAIEQTMALPNETFEYSETCL